MEHEKQVAETRREKEYLHACLKKKEDSFESLTGALMTAPVLANPRFGPGNTLKFILETDASIEGLGAVLSQMQPDGTVHLRFNNGFKDLY